jgi:hypothetical protein
MSSSSVCRLLRAALWAACLTLSVPSESLAADADDLAGSWVLALSGEGDQQASSAFGAAFDWALAAETWASFSAARSRSPRERADVTARTLSAGIDHQFGALGATLRVEQWGDPGEVESFDVQPAVYLRSERLTATLLYEQRDVDIMFTVTGPLGRTIARTASLRATGVGARLSAALGTERRLTVSAKRYDYSRDLSALPRIEVLNLLGASALTLTDSFLDRDLSVGLEWGFGEKLLDLSYRRDRSAVDRTQLETLDVGVLFPLAPRLDLEIDVGRGVSQTLESSTFAGVLLLVYGG